MAIKWHGIVGLSLLMTGGTALADTVYAGANSQAAALCEKYGATPGTALFSRCLQAKMGTEKQGSVMQRRNFGLATRTLGGLQGPEAMRELESQDPQLARQAQEKMRAEMKNLAREYGEPKKEPFHN